MELEIVSLMLVALGILPLTGAGLRAPQMADGVRFAGRTAARRVPRDREPAWLFPSWPARCLHLPPVL